MPCLWTLCNVVPFHADKCLNMYKMGLGCSTMDSREQKHQMIGKHTENSTYQNRWPMIFRHEYIQLIYLRENGHDNVKYTKKSVNYIKEPAKGFCFICNLQLKEIEKDCPSKIVLIRFYRKVQILGLFFKIISILVSFFFLKKEYFALKSYKDVDEIMQKILADP